MENIRTTEAPQPNINVTMYNLVTSITEQTKEAAQKQEAIRAKEVSKLTRIYKFHEQSIIRTGQVSAAKAPEYLKRVWQPYFNDVIDNKKPSTLVISVEHNGVLAGIAHIKAVTTPKSFKANTKCAVVDHLVITPSQIMRQSGKKLLTKTKDMARSKGYDLLFIRVPKNIGNRVPKNMDKPKKQTPLHELVVRNGGLPARITYENLINHPKTTIPSSLLMISLNGHIPFKKEPVKTRSGKYISRDALEALPVSNHAKAQLLIA